MSTLISWAEETWNPFVGCAIVSDECKNCYAVRVAWRMADNPVTPQYHTTVMLVKNRPVWTGKVNLAKHKLDDPINWRKPKIIFVNSMFDLFYEKVPDEWLVQVVAVMKKASHHAYLVLTKRPERITAAFQRIGETIPSCCWLGVSVGRQRYAERIDVLRKVKAPVRFISAEPLLEPLDLDLVGIDWVIVGGESGKRARPFDPDWARSLRD